MCAIVLLAWSVEHLFQPQTHGNIESLRLRKTTKMVYSNRWSIPIVPTGHVPSIQKGELGIWCGPKICSQKRKGRKGGFVLGWTQMTLLLKWTVLILCKAICHSNHLLGWIYADGEIMGWKGMRYRPVCPLLGQSHEERQKNPAEIGALPLGAGTDRWSPPHTSYFKRWCVTWGV